MLSKYIYMVATRKINFLLKLIICPLLRSKCSTWTLSIEYLVINKCTSINDKSSFLQLKINSYHNPELNNYILYNNFCTLSTIIVVVSL